MGNRDSFQMKNEDDLAVVMITIICLIINQRIDDFCHVFIQSHGQQYERSNQNFS